MKEIPFHVARQRERTKKEERKKEGKEPRTNNTRRYDRLSKYNLAWKVVREGQSGRDKERRGRTGNEMGCKDIVAHFGDQIHRSFRVGGKKDGHS